MPDRFTLELCQHHWSFLLYFTLSFIKINTILLRKPLSSNVYLSSWRYFIWKQALSYTKLNSAGIHGFRTSSLLATLNPTHPSRPAKIMPYSLTMHPHPEHTFGEIPPSLLFTTINSFIRNFNTSNIPELSLHWTLVSIVPGGSNYGILFSFLSFPHIIRHSANTSWMKDWMKKMNDHNPSLLKMSFGINHLHVEVILLQMF